MVYDGQINACWVAFALTPKHRKAKAIGIFASEEVAREAVNWEIRRGRAHSGFWHIGQTRDNPLPFK